MAVPASIRYTVCFTVVYITGGFFFFQVKFMQTRKGAKPLLPTQTDSMMDTSSRMYDVDFIDFSSPMKII